MSVLGNLTASLLVAIALGASSAYALPITFSGSLDDSANPNLFGSDLGIPSFDDSVEPIANNVAIYTFNLSTPQTVSFTSYGYADGGIDPYFTLFMGIGNGATFLASNFDNAFLGSGGDFTRSRRWRRATTRLPSVRLPTCLLRRTSAPGRWETDLSGSVSAILATTAIASLPTPPRHRRCLNPPRQSSWPEQHSLLFGCGVLDGSPPTCVSPSSGRDPWRIFSGWCSGSLSLWRFPLGSHMATSR